MPDEDALEAGEAVKVLAAVGGLLQRKDHKTGNAQGLVLALEIMGAVEVHTSRGAVVQLIQKDAPVNEGGA